MSPGCMCGRLIRTLAFLPFSLVSIMRLAVIVVSYNTRDLTLDCLASLRQHEPDADVIVVDNGSDDGSIAAIERIHPHVRLIVSDTNLGFARANNLAYQQILADEENAPQYVCLLNSDTVLSDAALSTCCDRMDDAFWLGAITPRLFGTDGKEQRAAHRFPTYRAMAAKALRREANIHPRPPHYLAGTCLTLRRQAISQAGGLFDPKLAFYWEDAELGSRLLGAGWQFEVLRQARITHHGGASGGGPDACRRPDLHAWYMFGRHYWFSHHRPRWESIGVWCLDAIDTVRMTLRGIVRPSRRHEIAQARQVAGVLLRRLRGRQPQPLR